MTPDPAGLAAVDLSNPQSLNRYAYVGNSPCSHTDPFGLAECDFTVKFNNNAGLSGDQISAIQNRINQIFGAVASPNGDTVGVRFSLSGGADATLTATTGGALTNFLWGRRGGLPPFGSEGGFWGAPKIYMNNLPTGFPAADSAMQAGGVGAHELAHLFTGVGDLPYSAANPNLFMVYQAPVDSQLGALINPHSALWSITAAQIGTTFSRCTKVHPTNPVSPGHGGGGGGGGWGGGGYPSWWYDMWAFVGWVNSIPVEVVTHKIIY